TPKRVIQLGFMVSLIGLLILILLLNTDSTRLILAPGLFIYGIGLGFGFSQLNNLTLSAVSVEQSGEASGVSNTLRQVGSSFGSAIIGAALIATLTSSIISGIQSSQVIPISAKDPIIEEVKAAGSNIEFVSPTSSTNTPQVITTEVTNLTHQATVKGNRLALVLTSLFTLIALVSSGLLPNIRDLETGKPALENIDTRH
ncbi:MFS transporter, partial [Candidatus Saccharibacteria bacterium]|nr:MFS transporter [Candidatus Saccharibacteria bacterium]